MARRRSAAPPVELPYERLLEATELTLLDGPCRALSKMSPSEDDPDELAKDAGSE